MAPRSIKLNHLGQLAAAGAAKYFVFSFVDLFCPLHRACLEWNMGYHYY